MPDDLVLANARLVLPGEVVRGRLRVEAGRIAAIDDGAGVPPGAVDCDGDLVLPGLVELHTDNLERHLAPRPRVDWPPAAAILAHDAELAGCGVTTVFDALRVGSLRSAVIPALGLDAYARGVASAILALRAGGHLRIDHRLHLRAELCSQTLAAELDAFGPEDRVGLVSLMDHTPGQRQFTDLATFAAYVQRRHGLGDDAFAAYCRELEGLQAAFGAAHERAAVAAARRLGAALASHDDTTPAQVRRSAAHGVAVAEFPTTEAAARSCRAAGIAVMMGAPNLVRGGSHSGNVAAAALAEAGLLDVLSSDYVPAALLLGAVRLGRAWGDLARGVAAVTAAPAGAAGLGDRGRLAEGLRADLVRVADAAGVPQPRGTWVAGLRVA